MFLTEVDAINEAFTQLFTELFKLIGVIFAFAVATGLIWLVIVAAIVTWVVKKVWYAGSNKKEKKNKQANDSDDWLTWAQERQEVRFRNASPPIINTQVKAQKTRKRKPKKRYNQADEGRTWYPTGWTLNENTGKWDPPDYLK